MSKEKLHLEAPWSKVKEMLKEANKDLTDADLSFDPGQEEQMVERVARKMGKNYEETKGWIESVSHTSGMAG